MSTGVTVDFNANLARFTSGVDKAIADLNKFQGNAERISGNISKAFGALGVGLGVGAFTAFIKGTIDAQDHLNDLSKTTRLSVEQLAGLSLAAKKSGSDLDGTAKAINKLAVEMGKDAEKFAALGVNAKSPLEAFAQLADVMNAIDDPQKRAAVGAVALGKSWQESAPLMAEGGKAIREMIEEGHKLSKVTAESAKRADEFNDKWEDLKATAGGWGVAIANPIVAGLLKITNALEMEVKKKPGSIAEFIFGPERSRGWTGPKDANGLPLLTPPAVAAADPGKPSAAAVKKFIGGEGAGKSGGAKHQREFDPEGDLDFRLSEMREKVLRAGFDARDKQAADQVERLNNLLAATPTGQLEKAREEMQFLAEALEKNVITEEQYLELVGERYGKAKENIEELDGAARDLGFTFSSAFEDAIVGGKDLSSVLQGLAQDVTRIFVRKTVTEPLGESLAGAFKGMGGGSGLLSGIKNLFTFDGGGYTGAGSRSGGLDGKGGFMAVLHPNETVTDHTKGGITGGVTIIQNINIDSRSDQGTIAAAMVQAKNAAVAEVHNAMRRGAWA